jgi:hypothetical protein
MKRFILFLFLLSVGLQDVFAQTEFLITNNPKKPKSGRKILFPKSDGSLYEKASDGTVKPIGLRTVNTAPANANDTGQTGDIYSGASGTYLCVAPNTWVKLATDSFAGTPDLTTYVDDNTFFMVGTNLKVGISLRFGGALYHFSNAAGTKNYINSKFLTGRAAGVSFYSDPEPYTVSGYTAAAGFENASWNPVQDGDAGNNPAPVLSYSFDGATDTFHIISRPLQWKFTGGLVETTVLINSYYTVMDDDKTLKCRFVVTVDRGVMNVPGRANETPFVYLTRDLNELVAYTGVAPWTGGATSVPTYNYTAFGAANTAAIFEPTEKWVWLHDGSGNGVGVVNLDFDDNWTVTKYLNEVDGALDNSNPCMIVQQTSTYTDTGVYSFEKTMYLVLGSAAETRAFAVANH